MKLTAEQFKALADIVSKADYAMHQLQTFRDEVTRRALGDESFAHTERTDVRNACAFTRKRLTLLLEDIAALERTCTDKETP